MLNNERLEAVSGQEVAQIQRAVDDSDGLPVDIGNSTNDLVWDGLALWGGGEEANDDAWSVFWPRNRLIDKDLWLSMHSAVFR